MFIRNRFLGAYDAAIIGTFPAAIQKFIADGQAEDPVFMDAYLTEVLALSNPYDRILKDLSDAFIQLEAGDFAATGLSGLGSIGSIFKKIAKAVVSLHQKLFAGLKASIRVTERVWHKYGNIILTVVGAVLAPFTAGASMAAASLLIAANTMYQKLEATKKAKQQSREQQAAVEAEAAAYTAETERQLDKFYADNQQWFVDNLGVTPDKWGRLTLDLKIELLKTGNTGIIPPEAVPIKAELVPVIDVYQYGGSTIETTSDIEDGRMPGAVNGGGFKGYTDATPFDVKTGVWSPWALVGRYDHWVVPTVARVPSRNTKYNGPSYSSLRGGYVPKDPYVDSAQSLSEDLSALMSSSRSPRAWLLSNMGLTDARWNALTLDQKFAALKAGAMGRLIPDGAVKVGVRYGLPVASMDIAAPPPSVTPFIQDTPQSALVAVSPPARYVPQQTVPAPQIKVTVPGGPPTPVYAGPVTPAAQAAIDQVAQAAALNVAVGVPWNQAVQGAVTGLLNAATTPALRQPAPTIATAGMFDGIGVPLVIAGVVLAAVFGKPVPAKRTRRNPRRRPRRSVA